MNYQPKVSVVMSVYNGEKYLRETLDTVVHQTLKEIEIILVCNGSTDGTLPIMEEYAAKDCRIQVYPKEYSEAGTGRNYGAQFARGKYVSFLDGDDLFAQEMLEKAYALAEKHQAEIVNFGAEKFFSEEMKPAPIPYPIMHQIPNKDIFTAAEVKQPFRTFGYYVWNKLYLRSFLVENGLCFLDQTVCEDTFLSITALCCAKRVCVTTEKLVMYRVFLTGATSQYARAAYSNYHGLIALREWFLNRGLWEQYELEFINLALEFMIDALYSLEKEDEHSFYEFLRREGFSKLGLIGRTEHEIRKKFRLQELQTIMELDYDSYVKVMEPGVSEKKHDPELIVSLTSYPKRIHLAHKAIQTLLKQREKADRVILWLAREDFPNREKDLPESILTLTKCGLIIEWCENLGSYKKLIPALKKYPDAVIVTADDDVKYNINWLRSLWLTYQKHPGHICCHRPAKLENKHGMYQWIRTGKKYYPQPSYYHCPISHAGVLYPPYSLHPDVLDEARFSELAATNDELWFWMMAVRKGTKIAVAENNIPTPKYVDGTQDVTLSSRNFGEEKLFERDFERLVNQYSGFFEQLGAEPYE